MIGTKKMRFDQYAGHCIVSIFRLHPGRDSHSQIPTVAETPSALTLARSNLIRLAWFDNTQPSTLVTIVDRVTVQEVLVLVI